MRLIDADKLKTCYTGTNGLDDKAEYFNIRKMIDLQPTAYNSDNVIEQLEDNLKLIRREQGADCIKNDGKWTPEQGMRSGMIKAYLEAIEIIKSGGVAGD